MRPVACSRTDSGVHALGQLAQLDIPRDLPVNKVAKALNTYLPHDIRIISAKKVEDDFQIHRRVREKEYAYFVVVDDVRPFYQGRATGVRGPLDVAAMKKALSTLVGTHDFKSFQAQKCSRESTVCTLHEASVKRVRPWYGMKGELYKFTFRGNAFLRHMIRNIMGMIIEIGMGYRPASDSKRIIAAKDRKAAGRCAPPDGLYLVSIVLSSCVERKRPQPYGGAR